MPDLSASESSETDQCFMAAAIRLSLWHRGLTGENPSVGAIIVHGSGNAARIVGSGVTGVGGRPHAEVQALAEAGALARGATVYCTLEPCSHIGRSPPCAEALVRAGVARVVISVLDPDIRVAGRGVSILTNAGVSVTTGCLEAEGRRALAGFLSLKARGRPWLTLKLAVSADGKLGRAGHGQTPITGAISRRMVQMMRVEHEAIMVGVNTVVEDDPLLTVRLDGLATRSPLRVVIDPFARLPLDAKILDHADASNLMVLSSEKTSRYKAEALRAKGAVVRFLASDFRGQFDPREILRTLGVLGVKSVLLEGGAETARRFVEAGVVDRIALFTGSTQVGADGVASPVTEQTVPEGFRTVEASRFGEDRLVVHERI